MRNIRPFSIFAQPAREWEWRRLLVKYHWASVVNVVTGNREAKTDPSHTVDYTLNPGAKAFDKQDKTVLYQRNPLPNWGPGSRAKNAKAGSVKRNVGEDGVEAGPEPTPTPTVSEVQPSAANGDGSIGEKRKSATLGGAEGSTETAQAGAEAGTEAKRAKVEEKGPVDVAEEEMMNV